MYTLRNSVQLVGNLGKDIDMKTFENGNSVANFSVATSEAYTNAEGEKIESTQWHNIVAWGKKAQQMSEHLSKGSRVLLRGKITYRSYEDKSGQKRAITEIIADSFIKLSKDA